MKKLGVVALAVIVLVSGGLVANSLFFTESDTDTTASTSSPVKTGDVSATQETSGSTSSTVPRDETEDAGVTQDAGATEDVEATTCGCDGGQFAANVSSGSQCAANGFCQSPVDCQSWDSYALSQLGPGPWPNGSTIRPDESCGLDCQWVLVCDNS